MSSKSPTQIIDEAIQKQKEDRDKPDHQSHDFVNDLVIYLEDFDFQGKILRPSSAEPNKLYIVLIFADWCGHCKHFIPEIKELSEMLANEKDVRLCCIDCSPNNVRPSQVALSKRVGSLVDGFQGFPTVVLYKEGEKKATYEGKRKAQNVLEFIQNSKHN